MNDEKLREFGGDLGVTEQEIRTIKRKSLGERITMVFENKAGSILFVISGIQGFIIGTFIWKMDEAAYPMNYEPPGGMLMPVKVFGGVAGAAGIGAAAYVQRKGGPEKQIKLFMILIPVLFSTSFFALTYCFGVMPYYAIMMYSVYSHKNKEVRSRGPHQAPGPIGIPGAQ